MALIGLKQDALRLILFGGKGGVGKTTCASSAGLFLAKDFKTLLISTDPAHSLSDSLGQNFGDEFADVENIRNLSALEVNAERALSKFKIKYEDQIKKILDTSRQFTSLQPREVKGTDALNNFKELLFQ